MHYNIGVSKETLFWLKLFNDDGLRDDWTTVDVVLKQSATCAPIFTRIDRVSKEFVYTYV